MSLKRLKRPRRRIGIHPFIERHAPQTVKTTRGKCKTCCEVCRSVSRVKPLTLDEELHLLCAKCRAQRRKRMRLKIKHGWGFVYLLREGQSRRYRCEHGSSVFVVLGSSKEEWTTLVCTFGCVHKVLSGFLMDRPEED